MSKKRTEAPSRLMLLQLTPGVWNQDPRSRIQDLRRSDSSAQVADLLASPTDDCLTVCESKWCFIIATLAETCCCWPLTLSALCPNSNVISAFSHPLYIQIKCRSLTLGMFNTFVLVFWVFFWNEVTKKTTSTSKSVWATVGLRTHGWYANFYKLVCQILVFPRLKCK